jgi:hypothetical protein
LFVQPNDAPSIRTQSHGGFVAVDVDRGNAGASRSAPVICSLHRKRFARERIARARPIHTRRFYFRDDFFI